ncbi:hypothetical protein GCM10027614_51580 [Micromonospora vulcania]
MVRIAEVKAAAYATGVVTYRQLGYVIPDAGVRQEEPELALLPAFRPPVRDRDQLTCLPHTA